MMKKILDYLITFERWCAGLFIGILTLLVLMDVASREIFKMGFPIAQKSAVYLMIWAGLLGAVMMSHKNEHLRPEVGDKLFKGVFGTLVKRFQHLLTFVFTLAFSYYSFQYVQESKEMGDMHVVLGLPMWWLQVILPYCFFSMSLRSLYYLFVLPPVVKLEDQV